MRGRAAPSHRGIYRVPPPPPGGTSKYGKSDYIYVSAVDPLKPNISEATLLKYYLFNDRGGGMKEEVFNPHVLI